MKIFDMVRVIADKEEYRAWEVYEGMIGQITIPDIKDNCFCVDFTGGKWCFVNVADLTIEEDGEENDEFILSQLPNKNPATWCKVENGYIVNLLGEKKNKIAYDYNS